MAYCENCLLLSPTRNGLQNLLQLCENYAEEHNISFSTNLDPSKFKSNCIYFTCGRDRKPVEVVLIYQKLPWVSLVDHLGHIIYESGSQERLEVPTLDHLLNYWQFSNSAHHCKSYMLCKLIVVPFMEEIFGTFSASMPVKPTDLGTLQLTLNRGGSGAPALVVFFCPRTLIFDTVKFCDF